jgi:restriction endonuclease Mrr
MMVNPKPNANAETAARARLAKKRARKTGTIKDALKVVWAALQTAHEILKHKDTAVRLKAVHAVSQTAATFTRMVEVGEFEARLDALEKAEAEHRKGRT